MCLNLLGSIRETPYRGPFLTLPLALLKLKRDLIERVYIPKRLILCPIITRTPQGPFNGGLMALNRVY